ncbi:hypothetical protein [uncultured Methanobrevibacter sp.]|uniref:hypothetical protein n=1 Tax=uncultured Methanobrevibacter sp. TaxID=253161 RepID=UPI00262C5D03|nr:hypothetical protein [uncultured Methanobrevibacter sp.]
MEIDYDIDDALNVLYNIKNNPYGIKNTNHSIFRTRDRSINQDLIFKKINEDKPVGIEKDASSSSRFLLIYEYTKFRDLAIAIDILNEIQLPRPVEVVDCELFSQSTS